MPTSPTAPLEPASAASASAEPVSGQVSCPVLRADIAGYAQADVAQQTAWRDALAERLKAVLARVPPDSRIVLDTETGLAVCFLAPAVQAARAAAALLRALPEEPAGGAPLELRIGLALGPVALVQGEASLLPRLLGDGVVVAGRMSEFAQPGEVLATRAFAEACGFPPRTRDSVFPPRGARTDALLRAHDITGLDAAALEKLHDAHIGMAARTARMPTVALAASALSVILLGAALVLNGSRTPGTAPVTPGVPIPQAKPPAPVVAAAAPVPAASDPAPPPPPDAAKASAVLPQAAPPAPKPAPAPAAATAKRAPPPHPGATAPKAVIALAVAPWGEIFVNGKAMGVSPPMTGLDVAPGRVTVEIRNPGFPASIRTLDLEPGQHVRVQHRF